MDSDSGVWESRPLAPHENEFVYATLASDAATPQECLFKGWVTVIHPSGVLVDRILVVSPFRVLLVKSGSTAPSVKSSFFILSLKSVTKPKDVSARIKAVFNKQVLHFIAPEHEQALQALLFASVSVSTDLPKGTRPHFDVGVSAEALQLPHVSAPEAFIASYMSMAHFLGASVRAAAIDYIVSCFHNRNRKFCFATWASAHERSPPKKELAAVCTALSFSSCFDSLLVSKISMSEEAVSSITDVLAHNSNISQLEVANVKISKGATALLFQSLGYQHIGVRDLTISGCTLSDSSIEGLAEALLKWKVPLHRLVLERCGMVGKGLKSLCVVLETPIWLQGLQVLGLGGNRFSKNDAHLLASVLRQALVLQSLDVSDAFRPKDCITAILAGLADNADLSNNSLTSLDISGSRLNDAGLRLLDTLIRTTSSLVSISMNRCALKQHDMLFMIKAARGNLHRRQFKLEFDLNAACYGPELSRELRGGDKNLASLSFASCTLGGSGIAALCSSLQMCSVLQSLDISLNMKASTLFSREENIGPHLVQLMESCQSLTRLYLRGDESHHWNDGLIPLFEHLQHDSQLSELDIRGAKLSDAECGSLTQMIEANEYLSVLWLDQNKWTVNRIRSLAASVVNNKALLDWNAVIPKQDISAICSSYSQHVGLMRELVAKIIDCIQERRFPLQQDQLQQKGPELQPDANTSESAGPLHLECSSPDSQQQQCSSNDVDALNVLLDTDSDSESDSEDETAEREMSGGSGSTSFNTDVGPRSRQGDQMEKSFQAFMPAQWRQKLHGQHEDVSSNSGSGDVSSKSTTGRYHSSSSNENWLTGKESGTDDPVESNQPKLNCLGLPCYPLRRLQSGAEFPGDVAVNMREDHLSDDAFEQTFHMSREAFRDLQPWKQKQRKKEVGLF